MTSVKANHASAATVSASYARDSRCIHNGLSGISHPSADSVENRAFLLRRVLPVTVLIPSGKIRVEDNSGHSVEAKD
jgi:hypothetical protein